MFFPDGSFVLSTVFLKSNIRIKLSEKALILGSLNLSDYCKDEELNYPLYQDVSHSHFHCSMFVGIDCGNIVIEGKGKIDMRSVWDDGNLRGNAHRGAKCIALKNCKNVTIKDLTIHNATDLAVYFAGCENVDVHGLNLRVYIDGISPDNCKNVRIFDCNMETGDDSIVFKSSYTLNRLDICKDIKVWNCRIKSRCNAIKFGTESIGGFEDIHIENIKIFDTRISAIAIESVDGAIIDGINIKNVDMENVNAPLFIHLGKRMRAPQGREIGEIKNIILENITSTGPYKPYDIIPWNYKSFKNNDTRQYPWYFGGTSGITDIKEENTGEFVWQFTSNVCGLKNKPLKNIKLKDIYLKVDGGVREYSRTVPEEPLQAYPEVYVYGKTLPAKGIYFRYADGLTLENVKIETYRQDIRDGIVCDGVNDLHIV